MKFRPGHHDMKFKLCHTGTYRWLLIRLGAAYLLSHVVLPAITYAQAQEIALGDFDGIWASVNPPGPHVIFTETSAGVEASLPFGQALITRSEGDGGSNFRISGEGFSCSYYILMRRNDKMVWELKAGDSVCPPNAEYDFFGAGTNSLAGVSVVYYRKYADDTRVTDDLRRQNIEYTERPGRSFR
jgi:hypothetical protein